MTLFHERLKQLKDGCGKTQMDIARDLGLTPQAFSYYINGREPSYDVLVKLADYFGVTTDYLLGRTEQTTANSQFSYEKIGLEEKTTRTLEKFKSASDAWPPQKEDEYLACLKKFSYEISRVLPDAGKRKSNLEALKCSPLYTNNSEYHDFVSLFQTRINSTSAQKSLKVINTIIGYSDDTLDPDYWAYETLAGIYAFLFGHEEDSAIINFLQNTIKTAEVDIFDIAEAMRTSRERQLLDAFYDLKDAINSEQYEH